APPQAGVLLRFIRYTASFAFAHSSVRSFAHPSVRLRFRTAHRTTCPAKGGKGQHFAPRPPAAAGHKVRTTQRRPDAQKPLQSRYSAATYILIPQVHRSSLRGGSKGSRQPSPQPP